MNDSDTIHVPLAIAVIVLSIASVLLISLAITCVFFDRNGHLRRFGRHASKALRVPNSGGRRPHTTAGGPRSMRSTERG